MSHVHASGTCNTFRYTVSLWNIGPPLPWTKPNSRTVFTDDWVGYDGSDKTGYHHKRIKDRKSTRLNSSHSQISYAVFCLKKKKTQSRQLCLGPPPALSPGRPRRD